MHAPRVIESRRALQAGHAQSAPEFVHAVRRRAVEARPGPRQEIPGIRGEVLQIALEQAEAAAERVGIRGRALVAAHMRGHRDPRAVPPTIDARSVPRAAGR